MIATDNASLEGNWLYVLFNGTARDFVREVAAARSGRGVLASLVAKPAAAAEGSFPLQLGTDEMRADLTDLGLTALDKHLKAEHGDGHPCLPDVHVYYRPAN